MSPCANLTIGLVILALGAAALLVLALDLRLAGLFTLPPPDVPPAP